MQSTALTLKTQLRPLVSSAVMAESFAEASKICGEKLNRWGSNFQWQLCGRANFTFAYFCYVVIVFFMTIVVYLSTWL